MEISLKDLKELFSHDSSTHPYTLGNVFIRTVTMAYTGRLVQVTNQELVLEDACWIADTGRFADFLSAAKLNECEPYPAGRVIIGRSALVDCCAWKHDLPRTQK